MEQSLSIKDKLAQYRAQKKSGAQLTTMSTTVTRRVELGNRGVTRAVTTTPIPTQRSVSRPAARPKPLSKIVSRNSLGSTAQKLRPASSRHRPHSSPLHQRAVAEEVAVSVSVSVAATVDSELMERTETAPIIEYTGYSEDKNTCVERKPDYIIVQKLPKLRTVFEEKENTVANKIEVVIPTVPLKSARRLSAIGSQRVSENCSKTSSYRAARVRVCEADEGLRTTTDRFRRRGTPMNKGPPPDVEEVIDSYGSFYSTVSAVNVTPLRKSRRISAGVPGFENTIENVEMSEK